MNEARRSAELHLHPRAPQSVTLSIPSDTLAAIRELAAVRGMLPEALMELYIGQGLRQDTSPFSVEGLGFLHKVERGLKQIEAGEVVPHEEARRRLKR